MRVGAERFSTITPQIFFGKGFGDLPEAVSWLKPFAITGQFGATYAKEPLATFTGGAQSGSVNEHLYQASVGFSSYELDLFGRIRSLTKAAQEQYFASEEARRTAQISLVAEVAGDWLTLAADRERLKIAQSTMAADQQSLDLILKNQEKILALLQK